MQRARKVSELCALARAGRYVQQHVQQRHAEQHSVIAHVPVPTQAGAATLSAPAVVQGTISLEHAAGQVHSQWPLHARPIHLYCLEHQELQDQWEFGAYVKQDGGGQKGRH